MKNVILIFAATVAAPAAWAESSGNDAHSVLSAPGGRYVFGQVSQFARYQYMLDTKAGRLWQIVVDANERASLEEIPYDRGIVDFAKKARGMSAVPEEDKKASRIYWWSELPVDKKQDWWSDLPQNPADPLGEAVAPAPE